MPICWRRWQNEPMKLAALALLLGLTATACFAGEGPSIRCDIGPVSKDFGKSQWLAYSCSDRTSLMFIAAPDNPAAPLYVFLHLRGGAYQLQSEGAGDKAASNAALVQLRALTTSQLTAILKETVTVASRSKR